jgi:deoxyadenosine/deoxycytidine kinase
MPLTQTLDTKVRIEIAGIIASGKTTLAGLFRPDTRVNVVLESFAQNPFYEAFYREPAAVAFETELTFSLLHSYAARRSQAQVTVCDFAGILDRAYSHVTLTGPQIAAFDAVRECVGEVLPPPTLHVYLICGPDEALKRIRQRQRPLEGAITRDYLCALDASLREGMRQSFVPSLIIDSEAIDFRADPSIQETVLAQIRHKIGELASITGGATPSRPHDIS